MAARVGPTAHYTGRVWVRHGLAPAELGTLGGWLLHSAARPLVQAVRPALGGMSLDTYLLLRHQMIDRVLEQAIAAGDVRQVIEVAAGLSPRGLRFARRHRRLGLRYLEADLPAMAERKQLLLRRLGAGSPNHHVLAVDLLLHGGPGSLDALASDWLEPHKPTAIIVEGLITYFDQAAQGELWRRLAAVLSSFPRGMLLADLELGVDAGAWRLVDLFARGLSAFSGSPVTLPFRDEPEAVAQLERSGFDRVELHRPADLSFTPAHPVFVRLLEARTETEGR